MLSLDRLTLAAVAGAALGLGCGDSSEPEAEAPIHWDFEPFVGSDAPVDVTTDRLCAEAADPDAAPDEVFIDCELEGASFAPDAPAPTSALRVMTWNVERGVKLDGQIAWLRDDASSPKPDVLLLSELDRGCSRSGSRNVARELAEALGMNYVFAVEFLELPREAGSGGQITDPCEHGNAILSRYPLGNVKALRHTANKSWRDVAGEPRLGGRVLVMADIQVGARFVHLFSLHFESSPADNDIQIAQAIETADLGKALPFGVAVAGDTNAPFYNFVLLGNSAPGIDRVTEAFFERGYRDTHAALPLEERGTRGPLVIDLIFGRGRPWSNPGICDPTVCDPLSDHRAVWATLRP